MMYLGVSCHDYFCATLPLCVSKWNRCLGTKSNANANWMHQLDIVDVGPKYDSICYGIDQLFDVPELCLQHLKIRFYSILSSICVRFIYKNQIAPRQTSKEKLCFSLKKLKEMCQYHENAMSKISFFDSYVQLFEILTFRFGKTPTEIWLIIQIQTCAGLEFHRFV